LYTLSRRQFGVCLAAGAVLSQAQAATHPAHHSQAKPYRIDVHHHFLPPELAQKIAATRQGGAPPEWSPELSLEQLERNGIQTAMASIMQPGIWTGNAEESRTLCRRSNDYGAKLVNDHPGRFGLFAPLPLPDTEGSLREIEYIFDTLKADGVGLMTQYDGKYPGDPAFTPVFEELNRRSAIVYFHPTNPQCCLNLVKGVTIGTIEFATDTSRAIASLVFSGTTTKFPQIRWIFSHGGGTMPFLLGRFEQLAKDRKDAFLPGGAGPELRKFYYEVAQATHAGALAALLKVAPVSQVLLGSDYPFRGVADAVEEVEQYSFTKAQKMAIERDNALRLMPRLKAL
jgi:predicted TIM-barrel fold metal-dependent hydrolase